MPHQRQLPSPPLDSQEGNVRKRVCKACDRCRLKKSKCDGASPCSRCRTDNAICVFGERKKSHDKVYPKGYVEMLEQQQSQLVNGLQELYRRTQSGQGWTGSPLKESTGGHPLTHDILERLGALQMDPSGRRESFEENLALMQRQLFEAGAAPMQRQGSDASGSDSGQRSIFDSPTAETTIFTGPFANYSYGQRGLPTPPTATSTNSFSSHHNSLRQASVYPGSPSSQSSMSPSQMNRPSFPAALSSLNDDFAFLNQLSGSSSVDLPMADIGRGCMPLDADGPCMMPDFTDDDFNAFVNRIP